MKFREMELGRGTLGYTGESPEYWAAKTRRGPVLMVALSIVLLIAGAVLVYASSYPGSIRVRAAHVTAVDEASGTVTVDYVDGAAPTRTATFSATGYTTDDAVEVTLGAGSVRLGDQTSTVTVNRWTGILMVVAGAALPLVLRRRRATTPGPTGE